MNLFQTFFPLGVLLAVALCGGWFIPHYLEEKAVRRRAEFNGQSGLHRDAYVDIEVVIANNQERLDIAMTAAKEAMRAASSAKREIREANRNLKQLAELEQQQQHRQAS
jgi:hypothetical protein